MYSSVYQSQGVYSHVYQYKAVYSRVYQYKGVYSRVFMFEGVYEQHDAQLYGENQPRIISEIQVDPSSSFGLMIMCRCT